MLQAAHKSITPFLWRYVGAGDAAIVDTSREEGRQGFGMFLRYWMNFN